MRGGECRAMRIYTGIRKRAAYLNGDWLFVIVKERASIRSL